MEEKNPLVVLEVLDKSLWYNSLSMQDVYVVIPSFSLCLDIFSLLQFFRKKNGKLSVV